MTTRLGAPDERGCHTEAMELAAGLRSTTTSFWTFAGRTACVGSDCSGRPLRGELRRDNDIDLLVEFHPGPVPGLLRLAALELELAELVGRDVELHTLGDLSRHFRAQVAAGASVLYDAA